MTRTGDVKLKLVLSNTAVSGSSTLGWRPRRGTSTFGGSAKLLRQPSSLLVSERDPEQMFLESLALIESIIAVQVRRHQFSRADGEDYGSWAKARLIDDDYAILRKFAGRSKLSTFLTTVLAHLLADFRNQQWGRWRPSAAASRLGPTAIRLEDLLYRDGCTLREAIEIMRSVGVPLTEAELVKIARQLPVRARDRQVPIDTLSRGEVEPSSEMSDPVQPEWTQKLENVLRELMERLPPEESLILRMRFWNNETVAAIARALRLEQKALYHRLDAIRRQLRGELEARGIDRELLGELLDRGNE